MRAEPTPTGDLQIPTPGPIDPRPKVVAFGDSFTAGATLEDWRQTYPARLQDDLDHAGYNLQVLNRGRGGDTSGQGLERLSEALQSAEVDIFILELGANDHFKGVPREETKANLKEIISRAQKKGAKILLCGYEPYNDKQEAESLEAMYQEVSRETGVVLLPSILDGVQQDPKLLLEDGLHPNGAGSAVEEQNVWKALQPLLRGEPKTKVTTKVS